MLSGATSRKDTAVAKEKGVSGVCPVARHSGTGGWYSPLSSGSVVRGLMGLKESENKVFLITSDIVSKEELSELQIDRKAFYPVSCTHPPPGWGGGEPGQGRGLCKGPCQSS